MRGYSSFGLGLLAVTGLTGCSQNASPAIPLFGAYFPAWLICLLAGVAGAVVIRIIFARLGVDDGLPFRLIIYTAVAAIIGFTLALTIFGR